MDNKLLLLPLFGLVFFSKFVTGDDLGIYIRSALPLIRFLLCRITDQTLKLPNKRFHTLMTNFFLQP